MRSNKTGNVLIYRLSDEKVVCEIFAHTIEYVLLKEYNGFQNGNSLKRR
ncbi:hypothetical protein [Filifactor villosus]|uniref:Toxin-antitoxin system, toxin component, RelE family n=1 Tax=Filifactor villosus TaxID=29374 RepID=A0ABV9QN02_9FIRM